MRTFKDLPFPGIGYILSAFLLMSAGCRMTPETYQERVHRHNVDRLIADTVHERNFRIWKKNQKQYVGMTSFNTSGPCPDGSGHHPTY